MGFCRYRRILDVLPKRLGRFGLTLHPEKTRLVDFRRPDRRPEGTQRERSSDMLGFTHYWGRSAKGRWVVQRKTAKARFTRTLRRFNEWCRRNRHLPVAEQRSKLNRKLLGHNAYFGITGNAQALNRLRYEVQIRWRYWLSRRSKAGRLTWEQFNRLHKRHPLQPACVVHSIYAT